MDFRQFFVSVDIDTQSNVNLKAAKLKYVGRASPASSRTCEVVEEVEGEGDAGGLRVEQGKLRVT